VCSAAPVPAAVLNTEPEELAAELVRRKIGLVYGGGNVGLMGMLADAVLKKGGEMAGVIPQSLMAREVGHNGLTKLHVVPPCTSASSYG
jgi:predicted Rossmann-fold nucleotide-binding protein